MAFSYKFFLVVLSSSLYLHAALVNAGAFVCEDLPEDLCAFSVASNGKRCLLETSTTKDNSIEYQCRTSEVVVERMAGYIETDECVKACGVDRNSVGISSDALLEPQFTAKLCSPHCYHKCHNIVDLYYNLAAGEGVYLPNLCKARRSHPQRTMFELLSSDVAPGPLSSNAMAAAPTSATTPTMAPI